MQFVPSTDLSFADLGVTRPLAAALARAGIDEPFPIQSATLPDAIAGRDILARGQTGSGKTLAFGLAVLTRLTGRQAVSQQPHALVLVPTRELAMQVGDTLNPLADAAGLRVRLIAGGMPYNKQIDAIRRGVHVLVATPGRLVDLVNRGDVNLSNISITVLDEADQMADMGFMPIVREILDMTRPRGQRLLFSATLDGDVDSIVRNYLKNPARHSLQPVHANVSTMDHHVLVMHPKDRDTVAAQIGARDGRTLFFARTQIGVDKLAEYLASQGVPVGALHGGKSQAVRTRTLENFRTGLTPALVATDVAARGIHVDGVSLVVHVDAPDDAKDYVHRAGRTARAGESGTVVTLSYPRQKRRMADLTNKAGVSADVTYVRPGDNQLVEITGATEPSGIAWIAPKQPRERSGGRRNQGGARKPRRAEHGAKRPRQDRERTPNRERTAEGGQRRERTQDGAQRSGQARKPKGRWSSKDRARATTRSR